MSMFCYQCEQTHKGEGCTLQGICGKDPRVAALQDYLAYAAKGIAQYAHRARSAGHADRGIDTFVVEALFTTVTNVNFDEARLAAMIARAAEVRDRARELCSDGAPDLTGPARFAISTDIEKLIEWGQKIGIATRREKLGADVTGLQELIFYGLKGAAAYADHAQILGHADDAIFAGFHEHLAYLASEPTDIQALTQTALAVGALNLKVMELLDAANTGTYGHPVPTRVRTTPVAGKCILVSGHDLKDLDELLKQTAGKGIHVYTHGEMLPCHGYPELKKHAHFVGHYGTAWQNQRREFEAFPGAILMTTNCIQKPKESYNARIFTSGLVAWPGVTHIADRDFTPVIEGALAAEGFVETDEEQAIMVGFGHQAVLSAAPQVLAAIKAGTLRHFFLIGGCDGAKPGRNYYTELAEQVPDDCLILTLACGKFRINHLELGKLEGLPRLLDMGQCNDAYSAIKVAGALAEALACGVNDLPLSLILSWYEQKAVVILLSLLHLGIKDIRIGPTLPAFITPAVLQVLVDTFGIKPITTPAEDLRMILGN